MKKKFIVFLLFPLFFLVACERTFDTAEDSPVTKPLVGKAVEEIFSTVGDYEIIKQKMGDEANFILRIKQVDRFLLSFMPIYYEETLKTFEWNTAHNSFFFFVDKSNRYRGMNRLVLFKIEKNTPLLLLDLREEQVQSVNYDNNYCIIKLKDNTEKKIKID